VLDLGERRRADRGAFTLIELLVVVSIISILSAIALPNFLEAQTRARVARMQADMRTVAVALEMYRVDNNNYIPRQRYRPGATTSRTLGDAMTRAQDMARLTTPISYISRIPVDVFENTLAPPNNIIDFWDNTILAGGPRNSRGNREPGAWNASYASWLLVSVGPDNDIGTGGLNIGNFPYSTPLEYRGFLNLLHDYDPTNGTISPGNIYRGPNNEKAVDVFN